MTAPPAAASAAWVELSAALNRAGTTPCQTSAGLDWLQDDRELQESSAYRCQPCPVISECLSYALLADERYGVWGGQTARQRQKPTAS